MSCFMSFVILVHEYSEREYCCISRYCRMSKGHAIGPVIVPFLSSNPSLHPLQSLLKERRCMQI